MWYSARKLDHFQTALDIASGIGNGLPVLGGKKLSEAVELSLYQFQKFEKNTGAPLRISCSPRGLSSLGVRGRPLYL
jgi:hypothetical protein